MARRYTPDTGMDPATRKAEDEAAAKVDAWLAAKERLIEEQGSRCASPQDIAFWKAEELRLRPF